MTHKRSPPALLVLNPHSHSHRGSDSAPLLPDLGEASCGAGRRGGRRRRMNWIGRKIHLYNVTIGLYMLDWWERYLFNILMVCLFWYILRYLLGFFQSNLKTLFQEGNYLGQGST